MKRTAPIRANEEHSAGLRLASISEKKVGGETSALLRKKSGTQKMKKEPA